MARRLSLTLGLLAAVLVAGAAAAMAAAGSSSNGRKGPRTFPAPVPRHLRRPGIRGPQDAPTLLWSQATAVGQMSAAPTLDGQFAFIQTGPNILSFFQQEGWITKVYNSTAPANGQGYSSPIINNGTVYFGAENNLFFAYDQKTGARVWEFQTRGPIMSSPAFDNGVLYFGDTQENYYAVSAADGTQLWRKNDCTASQPNMANGIFHQHIVVDGSNLYFGNSWFVCSVAKSDGTLQWSYQTGDTVGSSVVVTDQYVYAGSNDKCLYQLTLSGGNLVNSFCATSSPINSSPILKDGTIYYADDFGTVTALNADSLNLVWSMNYFQPTQGALLIVDDVLLAPNHAGVIGMDTVTGDTLWWWLDPQAAVIGGLAYNPQSNVIFFGDRIGTAYGLQLSSSSSSSSSSTRAVV